jgi:hypothetical protein
MSREHREYTGIIFDGKLLMKKRVALILFTIFTIQSLIGQVKTDSIKINRSVVSFFISDNGYGLSYSSFKKINRANEFEVGYWSGGKLTSILGFSLEDPFWCYNKIVIQGFKKFINSEDLYFAPGVAMFYGFFNDLQFPEYNGQKYYYPLISRSKMGVETLVKFGFMPKMDELFLDCHLGLGYKVWSVKEKLVNTYPYPNKTSRSNYWKNGPSVHIGIKLGFALH